MKTYIQPATCISEVQPQQMMVESELTSTPDLPGIGARHHNKLWDDDDDDWLSEK